MDIETHIAGNVLIGEEMRLEIGREVIGQQRFQLIF